ncbi:MAG: hypothetical protein ACXAC5_15760 [Promethearchaeota archaeon]
MFFFFSYKYNLRSHYGHKIIIEKKPTNEVYDKRANINLEIFNYYFDIAPTELITGIISELGVLSLKDFIVEVKEILLIEWFKYFLIDNGL